MDLLHPMTKRGEHQIHDVHRPRIQGPAGPGDVLERAVVHPVVLEVVQPPQGQRGAARPALGRVVVDHVEDDLEARGVQRPDHRPDLVEHGLGSGPLGGRRGQRRLRGEERHGRVAPVVREPQPGQVGLVHRGMDRQQLHARHAELLQVCRDSRMRETRVRAPLLGRHVGVAPGEPLDMRLVEHRRVPVHDRPQVVLPVEGVADDDRPHGLLAVIGRAGQGILVEAIEHRVDLDREERAQQGRGVRHAPCPRILEQPRRGEELPTGGVPRAMGPQPVLRARNHPGHMVPVEPALDVPQPLPPLRAAMAHAQVDGLGARGGHGEGASSRGVDREAGGGGSGRGRGTVGMICWHRRILPPSAVTIALRGPGDVRIVGMSPRSSSGESRPRAGAGPHGHVAVRGPRSLRGQGRSRTTVQLARADRIDARRGSPSA